MVYIVTAVHNRYAITEAFINTLLSQTYKDFQLILVDDGSTDGTAEMVKNKLPETIVLTGDGNLWWGGALHMAYKYIKANVSDSDYIFISNDDVFFSNDYIERAIAILSKHPDTILTGCGISKQTAEQVDGAIDFDFLAGSIVLARGEESIGNCASTRSIFLRAYDMKKIGGFHPILLPHYGSDYEWTIRANRKKKINILCVSSLKYEVNEVTTGDNQYTTLNRKKLFSKRSVSNPIYRINFILLTSPLHLIPAALINQLRRIKQKVGVLKEIMRK